MSDIADFANLLDADFLPGDALNVGDFDDVVDHDLVHDIDAPKRLRCAKYALEAGIAAADDDRAEIACEELRCRNHRPVAIGITIGIEVNVD